MIATIADVTLSLSRWTELSILVKTTLVLALGLMAARLAAHARASVRHLLLATTFATLAAVPVAVMALPGVIVRMPIAAGSFERASVPAPHAFNGSARTDGIPERRSANANWPAVPWATVLRWCWIAGVLALLTSFGIAIEQLRRMRRSGLPRTDLRPFVGALALEAGIRRAVEVVEHEDVRVPLICGIRHPAIVLPVDARTWDQADLRRALVHELEHVRRHDWLVLIAAHAICACYWFHPLVWMAWRQLCLDAERACDDAVVRNAERTDYADQLVLLARRLSAAPAAAVLGMANRSALSARIAALLDERQQRGRAGAFTAAAALVAAGLVVMAIAPVRVVATPGPTGALAEQSGRRGDGRQRRNGPLDRALYEAAESGDLADIDQLLQAGANVNCAIDGDGSPLIGAARANRLSAVRHLLDRGADPNLPVPGDGSPLIVAAGGGFVAIVEALLDRGAAIDQIVPEDENPLIQASGNGRLDVVKLLVVRGADVNARAWAESAWERPGGEWRTPLSMARKGGHQAVVAFLMSAGARASKF